MNDDFFEKKIIICCGSGGVGKTTTAAAIALEAASRGKKAVVLTIDPAKRLATALGLDSLGNEPKKILFDLDQMGARGRAGSPSHFYAMMLDTKKTFDHLIERYSTRPETRRAILENRLYQHMSSMIAGSQEYMAMEKLYEIYQEGKFDLLVLDTPPTRHALDFLDAPQKMINITGNSLLKWFLKPGIFAGGGGFGILQKGAEKILSVFDNLAGFAFLHELSEMISLIGNLLGGFQGRAQSVYDLLRKDFVGFILVSSPSDVSIQDALYFHKKIKEEKLPFLGFIVNRVHEPIQKFQEKDLPFSSPLKEKVFESLKNYEKIVQKDRAAIALLKKAVGAKQTLSTVPLFSTDVHDLEGLKKINRELFR
jgi:anion-transporting  ArsA/GET3 family ATPase